MATKYQQITTLYESTMKDATANPAAWTAFLQSACRNYKCRFDEQILIHAQRPDATAVLEIEKWNTQFGRWVNRGARGIAVFDDAHDGNYRLKHYFDVSDTYGSRFERPVPIWEMKPEYETDVVEHLTNVFGDLMGATKLDDALIIAAQVAVEDNLPDYLRDFGFTREGSLLEELDDLNLEMAYTAAVQNSVAYMLMTRCGIDASAYYDADDFKYIRDFNTPNTVNALGIATSDIAEMCLREIAVTVRNLQKEEKKQNRTFAKTKIPLHNEIDKTIIEPEGGISHDRSLDLPHGGRLQPAEPDRAERAAGNRHTGVWQVRVAPQEIPATEPPRAVSEPADVGQAEQALDGNRADSESADGADDRADGGAAERDGAVEGRESDAMGGHDEQHPPQRGGSDSERADLRVTPPDVRIKPLPTVSQQLNLFGGTAPASLSPTNAEDAAQAAPSAYLISQQIIDEVLTSGSREEHSALRIAAYFKYDHGVAENANFLRWEYGTGGKGFVLDGKRVAVWFDNDGLYIAHGDTTRAADAVLVTWEHAARRIRELLDLGRFMPQSELDKVSGYELKSLADQLWFLHRDRADGVVFDFMDADLFRHGFPDATARLAEVLAQPDEQRVIFAEIQQFAADCAENPDLLRFRSSERHLRAVLSGLSDLQREPLHFTADESVIPARAAFITQDEVDRLLAGGGQVQDGKYRIYSYFMQGHTASERVKFLRNEYGIGGGGRTGINEWHNSKGISFSRGNGAMPYDKILLPWMKVAKRIGELIAEGRYMNEAQLAHLPEYEKGIIAREIYNFYAPRTVETTRPYADGLYFTDAIAAIRPQLDDPARVAELLEGMASVLDNTADFDRNYEYMKKAFDDLTAFQDGAFSLFTPRYPTDEKHAAPPNATSAARQSKPQAKLPAPSAHETDTEVEYDLSLGKTVYLGIEEFEINAINDTHVVLRDMNLPLITLDMPRDVFERRLRENRLNDGLIKITSEQEIEQTIDDKIYIPTLGDRYEIQGRFFVVDTVNADEETVSLRDVTFESNTGFPIFRSESWDFMRMYTPIATEPERQPGYEEWREPATAENAPKQPGTPSDDIGEYLPNVITDANAAEHNTAGLVPAWEKPTPRPHAHFGDMHPEIPQSERHNFRITDDDLGAGGQKTKYKNNIAAILTLQRVEAESRFATPEEQEVLSRYVGWGGIAQAFDADNKSWESEYAELKSLLTADEYASARASTLNAHYTSPIVIKAIYKAIENMGFTTGNMLEPACGIGNFMGLVPESMRDSKLFGVELDSVTGRIAQQLYQQNNIAVQGYEAANLPDSFFDVAIGNVPFGEYSVPDKLYDKHKFHIHDYFFAKTLDKVRPGGVVAFVTSKGTLDKTNPTVRKYLAQRADLLGAIRLPNNAFYRNAGTEVTTDIIFLQKRDRMIDIEPDWVHLGKTESGVPVNNYFIEHPDMILGEMVFDESMYGGKNDTSCHPFPDSNLAEQLADAVANIHAEIADYDRGDDEQEEDNSIPADPRVRNFSYTIVDGQIYYRQDSRMVPVELPVTAQNRVRGLIELRECTRDLIMYQTDNYPDRTIQNEQTKLNRLYDSFIKKYGLINSRGNNMAFAQDSAYCLLCSLEILDENGNLERKADMFTKRTIKPHEPVTHVDTASEALAVSMAEKACVDLFYMSQLTGMTQDAIVKELEGVIFLNIGQAATQDKTYVTADEYLSGNIREKLALAIAAQQTIPDGRYDVNVNALQAAMPPNLTATEIAVRLGAPWVPVDVIQEFMQEFIKPNYYIRDNIKVHYSPLLGEWRIEGKTADRSNIHAFNTYGTLRVNAYKILEDSLNLRDVRVFDKTYDDNGKEQRVLNKKETAIAQAKQEIIRTKFEEWIWQDPARRERLCGIYNEKFNSTRPRVYDGSHIMFVGMNPEKKLHKHQVDAIAHVMYGGNTLLAHEVGAGKTYEMVAAAMESKRLGLCAKSLIVVPNHITEQWSAEFLQLYPSANILVATKKDFETKNRKKFCARIATGDFDAIIIGHSQFEKIPMSAERQDKMLKTQIDELANGIAEVKRSKGERYTIKQMERLRKNIEVRVEKLNDQSRKDDVVCFEELGIDRLFIDESHYFKNLFLVTKMRNVAGIAQTEARKSSDLFMKCRYLDELTGGRGVVFATGTPISNSMVEMYTIQRYLQYEALEKSGLQHFDAWASTFGETVTAIELAPEGTGFRAKTRFAKFYNLPELMSMFRTVADIQTADMLNLPVPKANFHTVVLKPSEWQREMIAQLAARAEKIRNREVDPSTDNMLLVTNDGRKLALDQRLINPLLPDDPEGKVSTCADNVFRIWEETKDKRLTQLIFSDLSTPKGDGSFNVYDDMKQKLMAKGIPAHEIAFIHSADTEVKKKELFAKVRKGQIRVLMGSTQKMGAGTNVQNRLIALHDCDCPWRPSDLAQRLGRIIRQFNDNPEVEIFRYVTEGTFDSYLYQLVENKQKFIAQIMTSKLPVRSAEDVDDTVLSYAEIKALATGNPLIIEKCQMEMDVGRLKILHASHLNQKYALEDAILKEFPQEIKRQTERIAGYTADMATIAQHPQDKDHFPPMTIKGTVYTERADAGAAIIDACKAMTSPDPVPLGAYRGIQMILSFESISKEYMVTLSGALSHTVKLGGDIRGNITRIDNILDGYAEPLAQCKERLANIWNQLEEAKREVDRPFPQAEEYAEKTARLKALNILLNMDEKDSVILDAEPDEGDGATPAREVERER